MGPSRAPTAVAARAARRRAPGASPRLSLWSRAWGLALLALGGATSAQAQGEPVRRVQIEPYANATETLTDNHNLTAGGSSDAVTQLTAGLSVRARSGFATGYLDYALTQVVYARHGDQNSRQNALNAAGQWQGLDGRLAVDAGATISRRAVSAFGADNTTSGTANANTTEVRTLRLTPSVRTQVDGKVKLVGQLGWTVNAVPGQGTSSSRSNSASLRLAPVEQARLGWNVDLLHSAQAYESGRTVGTDRAWGTVLYSLDDWDLQLRALAGHESSNVSTLDRQGHTTWGAGLAWTPSPRTSLDVATEQRAFGRSYMVNGSWRSPLTVWTVAGSRDIDLGAQSGAGQRGTAYTLLYTLYASVEPDPVRRNALVLAVLKALNWDVNKVVELPYLSSSATIVNRLALSAAWRNPRDAAVLTLLRSDSRRADQLSSLADDLSGTASLRSWQVLLNLSHRLTPESQLGLVAQINDAQDAEGLRHSRQRSLDLTMSQTLRQNLTVSLGLRRAWYDVSPSATTENALTATLAARF